MYLEAKVPARIYPVVEYSPIDGDSIRVQLDLIVGIRFDGVLRIEGVDAPELEDLKEKKAATACRDLITWWLSQQERPLMVKVSGRDKYGRLLGDIGSGAGSSGYTDRGSLGRWLLHHGVVRPYDGGKRGAWSGDDLERIERKVYQILGNSSSFVEEKDYDEL